MENLWSFTGRRGVLHEQIRGVIKKITVIFKFRELRILVSPTAPVSIFFYLFNRAKRFPFIGVFSWGKRKKSAGVKTGEYGG